MITIVPESVKRAVMERPDFPEIERRMKEAYGEDWKLATYSEAAEEKRKLEAGCND